MVFPFALMIYLLSPFIGKDKAIKLIGPLATYVAKFALIFFVPRIKGASEFHLVSSKIKERYWLWKPLFDYSIAYQNQNLVQLHVSYCPFYEALNKLRLKEMGPYICQGDWEIAKDYSDKWDFDRVHQIGTGDNFCDHTYKRKELK